MSLIVKIGWIAGVCAVIGLIFWTGAEPVLHAVETAGWAVVGVVLLRGTAVAGAGLGWFVLFPASSRPNAIACILIRFLREGANALLPMTQIGGEVIGARVLSLRGTPASLAAASVIVDVLAQAATQFLFALIGLATLGAMGRGGAIGETVAVVIAVAIPALCGFYLVQRPIGQRVVKTMLARVVGEREWLPFGAIDALYARLSSIYASRARLLMAAAIHMTVWLFGALEVWVILAAMGLPASYPEALVIESLMQAVRGAAFAIPGALGAQEGGLVAICAIFGVPAQAAIAMSLIKRVPDLVFGVPSLLGWQMLEGGLLFARHSPAECRRGE
jgi:putative membrane protein